MEPMPEAKVWSEIGYTSENHFVDLEETQLS